MIQQSSLKKLYVFYIALQKKIKKIFALFETILTSIGKILHLKFQIIKIYCILCPFIENCRNLMAGYTNITIDDRVITITDRAVIRLNDPTDHWSVKAVITISPVCLPKMSRFRRGY
ncbi:hypothetical protein XBKB1_4110004 [Xenorhabdus bovienii str. kraussei Becker Underwood]|uniref:Uncharacterized protein n=1 Tax=Xenorhabdus bovienii str. kraussei Becker Underwood TaxID=1398204 RepID=A0A077Q0M3_XENBV|nr:hypothetical protein XBKB1_4110004 [Xenorhabdus bovienii str. kraussei Becker Underwood]